jgi:hypothetical protein
MTGQKTEGASSLFYYQKKPVTCQAEKPVSPLTPLFGAFRDSFSLCFWLVFF